MSLTEEFKRLAAIVPDKNQKLAIACDLDDLQVFQKDVVRSLANLHLAGHGVYFYASKVTPEIIESLRAEVKEAVEKMSLSRSDRAQITQGFSAVNSKGAAGQKPQFDMVFSSVADKEPDWCECEYYFYGRRFNVDRLWQILFHTGADGEFPRMKDRLEGGNFVRELCDHVLKVA